MKHDLTAGYVYLALAAAIAIALWWMYKRSTATLQKAGVLATTSAPLATELTAPAFPTLTNPAFPGAPL